MQGCGWSSPVVKYYSTATETSMRLNRFTLQELHLLSDSLYWEFTIFEKSGWADTARARQLETLQEKIHEYMETR